MNRRTGVLALCVAFLLGTGSAAFAQDRSPPPKDPKATAAQNALNQALKNRKNGAKPPAKNSPPPKNNQPPKRSLK